jgi:hypothetical protein
MPGAVNVALRWLRAAGSATVACAIGNAAAVGLQATVTGQSAPTAPTITSPSSLVTGTVGTIYPTTYFYATGTAPITWSVTAGTLPTGMAFSTAGVLSGTPTATASGSITFTATNALGADSRALTLTVNAAATGITPEVTVWNRVRGAVNNPNPLGTPPTQPGQILQAYVGTNADWSGRRGTLATGVLPSQSGVPAGSIKLGGSVTGVVPGVHNLYITTDNTSAPGQDYYNITAWNDVTKIATVNAVFTDSALAAGANYEVCIFTNEALYQTVVKQEFQRRDTPVSPWVTIDTGDNGSTLGAGAYTTTSDDAGKEISVLQTVTDTVNGSRSARSSIFSIGTNALDPKLVYSNSLTYLGGFRPPPGLFEGFAMNGMSIDPTGDGGAGSIFATCLYEGKKTAEMTIPNPFITSNFNSLPQATFIQNPVEATEGAYLLSGTGGRGASEYTLHGTLVYNNKLILGSCNQYSGFPAMSHWRRPKNLSTTGQVEGGVWLDDVNQQYRNPRFAGGYMCHVPSGTLDGVNYQTALGGPVLTGIGHMNRNQTQSQGPCAWSFNPDDISGKTVIYGNCPDQSGLSSNQIKLAAGTTGIDTNKYIIINSGPPMSVGDVGDGHPTRIIGWDNATKIATVEIPYDIRPDASSTYAIFDRVLGKPLVWYPYSYAADGKEYALERTNELENIAKVKFQPVISNDGARGLAIPNGTRTLLAISYSGSGTRRYNNYYPQWNPTTGDSRAAEPTYSPTRTKIYAYDLNQVARVASGEITSAELVPYAVWYFTAWPNDPEAFIRGATYDPATRRLFISTQNIAYGKTGVFVWRVNNAVAV